MKCFLVVAMHTNHCRLLIFLDQALILGIITELFVCLYQYLILCHLLSYLKVFNYW